LKKQFAAKIGKVRSVGTKTTERKNASRDAFGHLVFAGMMAAFTLGESDNGILGVVALPAVNVGNGDTFSEIASREMDDTLKVLISKENLEYLKSLNYRPYATPSEKKCAPRAIITHPLIVKSGHCVAYFVYIFENNCPASCHVRLSSPGTFPVLVFAVLPSNLSQTEITDYLHVETIFPAIIEWRENNIRIEYDRKIQNAVITGMELTPEDKADFLLETELDHHTFYYTLDGAYGQVNSLTTSPAVLDAIATSKTMVQKNSAGLSMAQNAMDAGHVISSSKQVTKAAIKTGCYTVNLNSPSWYTTLEKWLSKNGNLNAEAKRTVLRYMSHLPDRIHHSVSPVKVQESFELTGNGRKFSLPQIMSHWLGKLIANCVHASDIKYC